MCMLCILNTCSYAVEIHVCFREALWISQNLDYHYFSLDCHKLTGSHKLILSAIVFICIIIYCQLSLFCLQTYFMSFQLSMPGLTHLHPSFSCCCFFFLSLCLFSVCLFFYFKLCKYSPVWGNLCPYKVYSFFLHFCALAFHDYSEPSYTKVLIVLRNFSGSPFKCITHA